ncbi:MAG TPA: polymorphic toxin-type HINT domain-containing protein [Isosphaeraceae bacterium]|nr:polymorphic toxin-type HINT domain-containing protein [Isosphaeraceae bacterium]
MVRSSVRRARGQAGATVAIVVAIAAASLSPHQAVGGSAPANAAATNLVGNDYATQLAACGRDPKAHLRLALWCEQHGLEAKRWKHLAIAVLADPANATARGLMGLVLDHGTWRSPEAVAERRQADAARAGLLAGYEKRRASTPKTADGHWKLGLWCEQQGLEAEAFAHFTAVTRLDPAHEAAWRRLGCRKVDGRWLTDAQVTAERTAAEAQRRANEHWLPLLQEWRSWLSDGHHRAEALQRIAGVTDPLALPAVWSVFTQRRQNDQIIAVQLLGQIDGPSATRALAVMAIFSPFGEVRRSATETLAHRDPRDALGFLVGLLRDPEPRIQAIVYRYMVKPVGSEGVGSPGILQFEGLGFNLLRFYTVDEFLSYSWLTDASQSIAPAAGYDARVMTQRRQQMNDLAIALEEDRPGAEVYRKSIQSLRDSLRKANSQVSLVLNAITGRDPGQDWEAWRKWWSEEQGYAYESPPKSTVVDLTFFQPKPTYVDRVHFSCFGAGTLVRTDAGLKPIETLDVGDQVLAQEPGSGALSFQPIVGIFHNRPAPALRITLEGESIVATGIHRFWRAGQGWVMARELEPGDAVRTCAGLAHVESVEPVPSLPVFNLEVAQCASFFVGRAGALVHDNSLVEPAHEPFDALAPAGQHALPAD